MAKTRRKREIKRRIDKYLKDFNSEDEEKRKNCLVRINMYVWGEHLLTRKQLNKLIYNLDKEDVKILDGYNGILNILLDNMKEGILPRKKREFAEKLKTLLEKYRELNEENKEMKMYYYLISILGILQDKIVIDYLIRDIRENKINGEIMDKVKNRISEKDIYLETWFHQPRHDNEINPHLSKILEKHETELHEFENELIERREKGKKDILDKVMWNIIKPLRETKRDVTYLRSSAPPMVGNIISLGEPIREEDEKDKNPFVKFIDKITKWVIRGASSFLLNIIIT